MRPAEGATEESYRAELVKSQEEVAKATKVVVIGSGAVGVEMAGVSGIS
jgi:NADH dehydrogenase FAD-containing subunit